MVRRNRECLTHGNLSGRVLVREYVVVQRKPLTSVYPVSSIGRDEVVQTLHRTLVEQSHEGHCLEYRSWVVRLPDDVVVCLAYVSVILPSEVCHSAYRSCLGLHHHHASAGDGLVLFEYLTQGLVCDVLELDVDGGPHVKTVLGDGWLNKDLFRFGVSRMANNLLSEIEQKTVAYF